MLVLSEKSGVLYDVDVLDGCTCPASTYRPWKACKHMRALSAYFAKVNKKGCHHDTLSLPDTENAVRA